jgi:hypothetical protein
MDSRISLLCALVLASSLLHCARSDGKLLHLPSPDSSH